MSSASGERRRSGVTDLDQFASELSDRRRKMEAGACASRADSDVSTFARARRKISDASVTSDVGGCFAQACDDTTSVTSRVFSRSVSLEQVVSKPEHVPEKLDFSQLEKFEGR